MSKSTDKKIFSSTRGNNIAVVNESFCSQVEIVGSHVRRGALVHCAFFGWRKFGLKLIGDFFGNLALDGKDIGQIAVILLGPDMRVIAGID